jgi:6-phosphogluconate dehydrogenase
MQLGFVGLGRMGLNMVTRLARGAASLDAGIDRGIPLPVMTSAVHRRFRSCQDNPFAERLLASLRNQFGGHAVKKTS